MAKNIKIALVTGGARRIGAAICRNLHKRNINLIIHYNESTKEAHNLQNELCKIRNDSVKIFKANLTNVSDCKKLIEVSISTFGRLDFLINNASTYYSTKIGERPSEGSSSIINLGRDTRALPIASICCSPPDKVDAWESLLDPKFGKRS